MSALKSEWKKVGGFRRVDGYEVDVFYSSLTEEFKARVCSQTDDRIEEVCFKPKDRYDHHPDVMSFRKEDAAIMQNAVRPLIAKLEA